MGKNSFAYFIATYNKADFVPTYKALLDRKASYPIHLVVSTDDPQKDMYLKKYDNTLMFDKSTYYDAVDSIGVYSKTHKICTYSRLLVDFAAKVLGYRYVGYLFDDINSFSMRYAKDGKIVSSTNFRIDRFMDMYIDLLNSRHNIYFTGPPNASFYIGINEAASKGYSTRFGNMMVYDTQKQLEPYKASMMEDMTIVLNNNQKGKMSICPFGLQVDCRDPAVTDDSYNGMTLAEYVQQKSIMCGGLDIGKSIPNIPYSKFTPKIIDPKYKKSHKLI